MSEYRNSLPWWARRVQRSQGNTKDELEDSLSLSEIGNQVTMIASCFRIAETY